MIWIAPALAAGRQAGGAKPESGLRKSKGKSGTPNYAQWTQSRNVHSLLRFVDPARRLLNAPA